jgi:hypothetical protein
MYHANVFYSFHYFCCYRASCIMYVKLYIMGRNNQFGILYILAHAIVSRLKTSSGCSGVFVRLSWHASNLNPIATEYIE